MSSLDGARPADVIKELSPVGGRMRNWKRTFCAKILSIVASTLAPASAALACEGPDEGKRRAVTKVRLLPEIEAWAAQAREAGSVVQYALLLEESRRIGGRCYWTVEVRADGQVWHRVLVTPDGRRVK